MSAFLWNWPEVVCMASLDLSFMKMLAQSCVEVGFMPCYGFIKPGSFFLEGGDDVSTWGYDVHSRLYSTMLVYSLKIVYLFFGLKCLNILTLNNVISLWIFIV